MTPEQFQDEVDWLRLFCEEIRGGCCEGCPEEELCDILREKGLLSPAENSERELPSETPY